MINYSSDKGGKSKGFILSETNIFTTDFGMVL